MFRRASWFAAGAAAGTAGAVWGRRTVKRTASKLAPANLGASAVSMARDRGRDLAEAVKEGRVAMVAKERELKARRDGDIIDVSESHGQIVEGHLGGRPVRLVLLPGQDVVGDQRETRPTGGGRPRRRSRR